MPRANAMRSKVWSRLTSVFGSWLQGHFVCHRHRSVLPYGPRATFNQCEISRSQDQLAGPFLRLWLAVKQVQYLRAWQFGSCSRAGGMSYPMCRNEPRRIGRTVPAHGDSDAQPRSCWHRRRESVDGPPQLQSMVVIMEPLDGPTVLHLNFLCGAEQRPVGVDYS